MGGTMTDQIPESDGSEEYLAKLKLLSIDPNNVRFEALIGMTITSFNISDDFIVIKTAEGMQFRMLHHQECCECVTVEDICGDVNDLLDTPVTMAEEVTKNDPDAAESGTWTFYKLGTVKGSVTIRWYGSSSGYYSESVGFELDLPTELVDDF